MEETFKGVKKLVITISVIIFINIVVLYSCEWMECYKVSLTNVVRMNLLCNACNRVTYDLINYQMVNVHIIIIFLNLFDLNL